MNCWTTYNEHPCLHKPNRTLLGFRGISFLVPKLLLGNANFSPSSAGGHLDITPKPTEITRFLSPSGSLADMVVPKQELGNQDSVSHEIVIIYLRITPS